MNINKYFAFAESISRISDFCGNVVSRHTGCVIVHKNKIVSVGWNTSKEHPMQKKYNRERGFNTDVCINSLHAEMYALIKSEGLEIDWSKATIFVYRKRATGIPAMARPCKACMKAILDRGIHLDHIYYTNEGGEYEVCE